MTDDYLEFHRLEKKITFGGCFFFDKEIHALFDIRVEKSLGLHEVEPGIYNFITSQPVDDSSMRFYTPWQANVTDLDNTTVEMLGYFRINTEEEALVSMLKAKC